MPFDAYFSRAFLSGRPYGERDSDGEDPGVMAPATPDAVRYDETRHGSTTAFVHSADWMPFVAEVRRVLSNLRAFAAMHPQHLDVSRVHAGLNSLEERITVLNPDGESTFGTRAESMYGFGKALLDRLGVAMANEQVPLPTRLKALRTLAEDVNVCVDGVITHLSHCLRSIDGQHSPLLSAALEVSAALINEAMLATLRQHHVHRWLGYVGNELHYVNGLEEAIFPALGRALKPDRLALQPNDLVVQTCLRAIDAAHQPETLAMAIADRIRDRFNAELTEKFGLTPQEMRRGFPFGDDRREATMAIAEALSTEFGELPLDTLIDWEDTPLGDMQARLPADGMLLGAHVRERLKALGALTRSGAKPFHGHLDSDDPSGGQVALRSMGSRLFWVEWQGGRRGFSIDDLLGPTMTQLRLEHNEGVKLGRGRRPTEIANVGLDSLTRAAIDNAWPHELMRFPGKLLHGAEMAGALVRGLDDDDLQTWLTRAAPDLNRAQRCALQEVLVLQGRERLLVPQKMMAWCELDRPSTSPELWRLALKAPSEGLLPAVGNIVLSAALHGDAGQPAPGDAWTWLLSCLHPKAEVPAAVRVDHPLASLLRLHPQRSGPAVGVMLEAHAQGLSSRSQLMDQLAVGDRLMGAGTSRPGVTASCFAQAIDRAHQRISLTSDELAQCIGEGPRNPAFCIQRDSEGPQPAVLMETLLRWLQEERIHPDQWMRLMSPSSDDTPLYSDLLAIRLLHAPVQTTATYMAMVCAAADTVPLTRMQLLALLRGQDYVAVKSKRGDLSAVPSPLAHFMASRSWEQGSAEAAERLQHFMAALQVLSARQHLKADDVQLALTDSDLAYGPAWKAVRTHPADHPCRLAIEQGLAALVAQGTLTQADVAALLEPGGASVTTATTTA